MTEPGDLMDSNVSKNHKGHPLKEDSGTRCEPVVTVSNLVKVYPSSNTRVLDGLSLTVYPGELTLVMGRSGSGKSALLNCIAGLEDFSDGEIEIAGSAISNMKVEQLAKLRLQNIGIVFQFFNLLNSLTVFQNLLLPAHLSRSYSEEKREYGESLLKLMGIENLKDRYPHEISGGEAQRVAVARALLLKPKVVLADEPTGNLDQKHAEQIFSLFQEIVQQFSVGVLMVTHDEGFARDCDSLYQMDGMGGVVSLAT